MDVMEPTQQGFAITSDPRIKTVVRFFDESGVLTNFTFKAARIRARKIKAYESFGIARSAFRRWILDMEIRALAGKTIKIGEKRRILVAKCLRGAILASREVALEELDHSFRPVRRDEMYDLLTATERSTAVWLFIFKPNELFSDKNEVLVASAL